jgi:hypothetical protein
MIPSNTLADCSPVENAYMAKKSEEFLEIFLEISKLLSTRKMVKLKISKEQENNSIWLDPSIRTEYFKLMDAKMPVQEIFSVYERWFNQLYNLAIINEQRLHKKKIAAHMAEILIICASFEKVLSQAANGKPVAPPSQKNDGGGDDGGGDDGGVDQQ